MVRLPVLWRHSCGFSQVQDLGELLIGRSREVFEGSRGEPIRTFCLVGDIFEDGFKQREDFAASSRVWTIGREHSTSPQIATHCFLLAPGRSSPGRFWKGRSRTLSLFLREPFR